MNILITDGPSNTDPTHQIRVTAYETDARDVGRPIHLASIGWRIKLATWFVRRYVAKALNGGVYGYPCGRF